MIARLLIFVFSSSFATTSLAQEFSGLMSGSDGLIFSLEHLAEAEPDSTPGFTIQRQRGFTSIPVYSKEDGQSASLILRGDRTLLGDTLYFADRNVTTPRDFGTIEIGGAWQKKEEDGDRHGLSLTYGSAGRRLLDNGETPIITGNFLIENKISETKSWIYVFSYSNNRVFLNNIPLPGFAYVRSEKTHTLVIGAPFLFGMWRLDPWHMSASLSPWSATSDVAYRFYGPFMAYSNLKWTPKAYENLVENSDDRFIFDKKEWGTGLRAFFGRRGSLSVGYLWNFDRRFLLGESLSKRRSDAIAIGDSGGFQLQARVSF